MSTTNLFKVCLVSLLFSFACVVDAKGIAKVLVSVGDVEAVSSEGESRALKRRSQVFETDTVTTQDKSKTQLRFTDGSMVALSPNSLFKIEEYQLGGDKERAVYNLIKGGMQTITGAIGKNDKQDYVLKTPVATIGIRGTFYQLFVTPSGGLVGYVKEGGITVENSDGTQTQIQPGQYFSMDSAGDVPTISDEPPQEFKEAEEEAQQTEDDEDSDSDNQDENEAGDGESSEGDDADNKDADGETDSGPDSNSDDGTAGADEGDEGDGVAGGSSEDQDVELDDGTVTITTDTDDGDPIGVDTNPGSFDQNTGGGATNEPEGTGSGTGKIEFDIPASATDAGDGNLIGLSFSNKEGTGVDANLDLFLVDEDNQLLINGTNQPIYIEVRDFDDDEPCNVCQFFADTASVVDVGGNVKGVNWGRWTGNFQVADNGELLDTSQDPNFHFIFSDKVTPYSQLTGLGASSVTFEFDNGTNPTDSEGNVGGVSLFNLTVDFTTMQFTGANIIVNVGSTTYTANLPNPTDISTTLVTDLKLDLGEASATFIGANPSNTTDIGIATVYSLDDPAGTEKVASGAVFLLEPN